MSAKVHCDQAEGIGMTRNVVGPLLQLAVLGRSAVRSGNAVALRADRPSAIAGRDIKERRWDAARHTGHRRAASPCLAGSMQFPRRRSGSGSAPVRTLRETGGLVVIWLQAVRGVATARARSAANKRRWIHGPCLFFNRCCQELPSSTANLTPNGWSFRTGWKPRLAKSPAGGSRYGLGKRWCAAKCGGG